MQTEKLSIKTFHLFTKTEARSICSYPTWMAVVGGIAKIPSECILKELKDLQKDSSTSCRMGRTISKVVEIFGIPTCYLEVKLEKIILGHSLFDEKTKEPKKINEATEGNNKNEVKKEGADKKGVEPWQNKREKN